LILVKYTHSGLKNRLYMTPRNQTRTYDGCHL